MDVVKIPVLCIIAALVAVFLKQYKGEYAMLLSVAASAVVMMFLVGYIAPTFTRLYNMAEETSVADYIKTALKALGISYITAFAANTCRDFGQTALAAKAELAGKCAIAVLSMPLLATVLELALGFAKI